MNAATEQNIAAICDVHRFALRLRATLPATAHSDINNQEAMVIDEIRARHDQKPPRNMVQNPTTYKAIGQSL